MKTIIALSISCLLSVSAFAVSESVQKAAAICGQKRGMFVYQNDTATCFDPKLGAVNGDHWSPAPGHNEGEIEGESLDLLTGKMIKFYGIYKEFKDLTVCNYTDQDIFVSYADSMDIFTTASPLERLEGQRLNSAKCKTKSTHMFAMYPNLNLAKKAIGICGASGGDTQKTQLRSIPTSSASGLK